MTIAEFKNKIDAILDDRRQNTSTPNQYAAHYTNPNVPRILLEKTDSNLMRQYDGDYMNDPEEGRYLVDVMIQVAQNCAHPLKDLLKEKLNDIRGERLLHSAYKKSTFLSCWTQCEIKQGEEDNSDSLDHWRFYGDDGKGACIMIPLSHLVKIFPQNLYRVTYGTDARGGGSAAAQRPIRKLREALKARFNAIRKTRANALKDIDEIIETIHPLLFLFKSSSYASELELRSITHKNGYSSSDGVCFDDRTPRRAFIKSPDGLICNKSIIHYGPKADHKLAIDLMGLAADRGISLQVHVSSKKYR